MIMFHISFACTLSAGKIYHLLVATANPSVLCDVWLQETLLPLTQPLSIAWSLHAIVKDR
jgi:hypothetical protein